MGVEITAIIGHTLNAAEAFRLPLRFGDTGSLFAVTNDLHSELARRWAHNHDARRPASWVSWLDSVEPVTRAWHQRDLLLLDVGAAGLWTIGPHAIAIDFVERFLDFVEDAGGIQRPIRRFCAAVARDVGSTRAVYLPDSGYPISIVADDDVADGRTFHEMLERLRTEFGSPATTIASMVSQGPAGRRVGYFVDELADV